MTEQQIHLSLSPKERLELLDKLEEPDFRRRMIKDPSAAMAELGIEFSEEDFDALVKDGLVLPSVEDLRAHKNEFKKAIKVNGAAFWIQNFFCLTDDCKNR